MLGVLCPVGMVGHHGTAGAGGDDLVAVKAVAADVADGTGKLAGEGPGGVAGAQGLGGVLNEDQAIAAGNVGETDHVGHVAEDMHGFQRLHMGAGGFVVQLALPQFAVIPAEGFTASGSMQRESSQPMKTGSAPT